LKESYIDADGYIAIVGVIVGIKPRCRNEEFKNGNVGTVHTLGVGAPLFKNNIDVLAEVFHILKNAGEGARFARFRHNKIERHG